MGLSLLNFGKFDLTNNLLTSLCSISAFHSISHLLHLTCLLIRQNFIHCSQIFLVLLKHSIHIFLIHFLK